MLQVFLEIIAMGGGSLLQLVKTVFVHGKLSCSFN
jgi:hypothetical protein